MLRKMIKKQGFTNQDVAAAIGVHLDSIYRWDKDIRVASFGNIIDVCNLLGCSPVELAPELFNSTVTAPQDLGQKLSEFSEQMKYITEIMKKEENK